MRRAHLAEGLIGSQYGSEMVEDENSRMADLLADKVKNLKSLSIDIGHEVREQNKFLKGMPLHINCYYYYYHASKAQRPELRVRKLSLPEMFYKIQQDNDFDNSTGFLQSTMNRVTAMAKAGHHCYLLYLFLFACFVFFVCWLIIKTQ